jgi:hypothetical protein
MFSILFVIALALVSGVAAWLLCVVYARLIRPVHSRSALPVTLLSSPQACLTGLRHLGNLRLAEECRKLAIRSRVTNEQRDKLDGVQTRTAHTATLRPVAR